MRRAISLFSVLGLLFPGLRLLAQSNGAMPPVIPSPTAASLGKFGDVPVNFYTGLAEIRIPLFTAQGKTLELPIALTYHASGIKVEEIGSWVGAGWALEAGGVITRTVRGIVDEKPEGYFNTGHTFYESGNWSNPPDALLLNIHNETVDGEPDQFFFNFAGQSGEIVAGPTTSNPSDPTVYATIPYRRWRVETEIGPDPYYASHVILSWVITTEDGTRYTFDALEVQRHRTTQWQGSGGREYLPYTSSWYLTEIRAPEGDVITLAYEPYAAEHHMGMYREEVNDKYESPAGVCATPGYQIGSSTIYDLHSQAYINAQRLTSITTAAHAVAFTHTLREDARSPDNGAVMVIGGRQQQEPRLDQITVTTPGGVVLRRFAFEHDYSLGGRLTLRNVYEVGSNGDSLPPYSFTYSGPTLPERVTDMNDYHDPSPSASFALDHWGYHNGKTANTTTIPPGVSLLSGNAYGGADRTPDFEFTKAGVLTKITYPTGGFNEFIYEPNEYSTIADGSPLIQDAPVNHDASAVSSPGDPAEQTTDFTVGGVDGTVEATVDVYVSEACGPTPCPVAELWRGASNLGTWTSSATAVPISLSRDSTYTLRAWNQGQPVTVAITVHWQERVAVTKKPGAGVRIAEVRADDGMGNVTIRKYSYLQADLVHSTGVIGSEPRYDYTHDVIAGNSQCAYFSRSSASRIPLGGGPVVGYSAVTGSRGAAGEFGSTHRTFVAGGDFPAHDRWPYLRYTSNAWQRGHQATTEEYDASGATQRYTLSTYTFPAWAQTTTTFRGLAVDVYSVSVWNGIGYLTEWNPFEVESALKLPSLESTTFYDTTGQNSFFTTRQFAYGNPNHAQLTEISEANSDGTERITRMRYPADYATGSANEVAAALTAMQGTAHMHGAVIERWVLDKVGTSETLVQAQLTTYKEYLAGQYLPYQRFIFNAPSPSQ